MSVKCAITSKKPKPGLEQVVLRSRADYLELITMDVQKSESQSADYLDLLSRYAHSFTPEVVVFTRVVLRIHR